MVYTIKKKEQYGRPANFDAQDSCRSNRQLDRNREQTAEVTQQNVFGQDMSASADTAEKATESIWPTRFRG